jgi:peptidoglycan glycosyltransferase
MNDLHTAPRDLARVTLALLIAFATIALAAGYWGVIAAPGLRDRDDNARNIIAEQRIRRGVIFDRAGKPLALSSETVNGLMVRRYPHLEAVSATGYYSLTYGTAGIEAAYDSLLRGDEGRDRLQTLLDNLLHRPPQGGDVRTTLDLRVQQAVAGALAGRAGAAIVLDVPTGAVRALVSQPGFDPNALESQWDTLVADQRAPLLNRVTAGLYQPGGVFQTVLLAALFAAQPDLSDAGAALLAQPADAFDETVHVDDLTLGCLHQPPTATPTLADAYAFGCPAPFLALAENTLSAEALRQRLEALGLLDMPVLNGFPTAPAPVSLPAADVSPAAQTALWAGQGTLTLTPLHLAQVVAAIAHGGNAVPLHLVDAVRPPDSADWQSPPVAQTRDRAMLRTEVASALEQALAYAARTNPDTAAAAPSGVLLFGHSALAYAGPGETPYAWFYGYVRTGETGRGQAIVVIVVIEDERNPAVAARVARAAFESALSGENTLSS